MWTSREILRNLSRWNSPLGGSVGDFIVRFELVIRTKGLMIRSYSAYQTELSDRVIHLRDVEGLTYKSLAGLLIEEGYRSPRGFDLSYESVFSIYKKRKKGTPD